MITYEKLTRHPNAAPSLIGMSLSAFTQLYAEFEVAHVQRTRSSNVTRRQRQRRQRAVGAGRRYRYDLRDRLLMTLFWMRCYMTYEVLGYFYDLDKTNIENNLKDVLATLDTMTTFTFERRRTRSTGIAVAVMTAFPMAAGHRCQRTTHSAA
jgi:hypothetical protein